MATGCQKIPYASRGAAVDDARVVRMAYRNSRNVRAKGGAKSGRKLRPYKCPFCGAWHLTSKRKYRSKRL